MHDVIAAITTSPWQSSTVAGLRDRVRLVDAVRRRAVVHHLELGLEAGVLVGDHGVVAVGASRGPGAPPPDAASVALRWSSPQMPGTVVRRPVAAGGVGAEQPVEPLLQFRQVDAVLRALRPGDARLDAREVESETTSAVLDLTLRRMPNIPCAWK